MKNTSFQPRIVHLHISRPGDGEMLKKAVGIAFRAILRARGFLAPGQRHHVHVGGVSWKRSSPRCHLFLSLSTSVSFLFWFFSSVNSS